MSRKIEFRAYDKWRKEYLSAGQIYLSIEPGSHPAPSKQYLDEISQPNAYAERFVIEQFTSLKDKNGREIYEGDIVQWQWEADHPRSEPKEVVAKFGAFGYMYCDGFHSFVGNTNFTFCELGTDKRVEIVGNIHDNPELLKMRN